MVRGGQAESFAMRLPPGMCAIPQSQLAAWMPAAAARTTVPSSEAFIVPCEALASAPPPRLLDDLPSWIQIGRQLIPRLQLDSPSGAATASAEGLCRDFGRVIEASPSINPLRNYSRTDIRLLGMPSCALEMPPGRPGHTWIITAVESSYLSIALMGDADFRSRMLSFISESGSFGEAYGTHPAADRVEIDLDGKEEFSRGRWRTTLYRYAALVAVVLVAGFLGLKCGKRFRSPLTRG